MFAGVSLLLLALSTSALAGSQTGFEGTISAGNINFTATLMVDNAGFDSNSLTCTGGKCNYSLTFTGLNNNSTTATLNLFGLQLFGSGGNASFDVSGGYSIPSNWMTIGGEKIVNNSGGLGCKSSGGFGGWLCASALTMPNVLHIGSGQTFTTTFAGTFQHGTSIMSAFDLQSNGLTNMNKGNSKWSISNSCDWNQFTPIPEPETWSVLGSGLFTAVWLLRRRLLF